MRGKIKNNWRVKAAPTRLWGGRHGLLALVLALSACGQSGKLYLPVPSTPLIVTPPPVQEVGHHPLPATNSIKPS